MKDYYMILGLPRNCSQNQIKSAYRKKAQLYHPDCSKSHDASRFREIQEAYENIGCEEKRNAYDAKFLQQESKPVLKSRTSAVDVDFFFANEFSQLDSWQNLFNYFFCHETDCVSVQRSNYDLEVILSRKEAVSGLTLPIKIPLSRTCPACNGFTSILFSDCYFCHGRGVISEYLSIDLQIPAGIKNFSYLILTIPHYGRLNILIKIN